MGWEPMAVRAARWAFLGVLVAGTALAAEPPATVPVSDLFPVVTDARLGGDDTQTRFVMDLDRKIDLHVFTLADPYRVVLDIPQVRFQLPPKAGEGRRADQGVPLRAGDAGRLTHGVRPDQARARRKGVCHRRG